MPPFVAQAAPGKLLAARAKRRAAAVGPLRVPAGRGRTFRAQRRGGLGGPSGLRLLRVPRCSLGPRLRPLLQTPGAGHEAEGSEWPREKPGARSLPAPRRRDANRVARLGAANIQDRGAPECAGGRERGSLGAGTRGFLPSSLGARPPRVAAEPASN
ncbi:uncharacterized protein LOC144578510 [Callithrix jacchus]